MMHEVQRETLLTVGTEVVRNKVFKTDGFEVYISFHVLIWKVCSL